MRGWLVVVALTALGLTACESTQDKSARLKAAGAKAFTEAKGLSITRQAQGVRIAARAVITDPNGTAVALVLRNSGRAPLPAVPIAIDVRSARGKSVFKNDAAGLEPSLTSVGVLPPGQETAWVNDQVTPSAPAKRVRAQVGAPKAQAAANRRLPQIALLGPKVMQDPSSGTEVVGRAKLRGGPAQRNLIVYCLARKGGRIVAAGRAEVPRLTAKKAQTFHVFPIGDPRGARLSLSAPPTVL